MDRVYKDELKIRLDNSNREGELAGKRIYLFGHCEATLTLTDMLLSYDIKPVAIMDNNPNKYDVVYKGITVQSPDSILNEDASNTIVLIVTRFYESMNAQLRKLGFTGEVRKLVDYNTYAEYSLSDDTIKRKRYRLEHGQKILVNLRNKYPEHLFVFCPFQALGDIYFCMSYLPAFMKKRRRDKCVLCVVGDGCGQVVSLFGSYPVEIFVKKELDAAVQACLYENRDDTFIAHQDRPYVVDLNKALYIKKIPLEKIYCCGVFGLPADTVPAQPVSWKEYSGTPEIEKGKSAVLSPYAKSVPALPEDVWTQIGVWCKARGYRIFTNVFGDEKPLDGTEAISPALSEMKSVMERAGLFIGIRSGLCDVIRTVDCRKIALYPDYQYCDTQWKSIDIYSIDGFENIVVKDGFKWEMK